MDLDRELKSIGKAAFEKCYFTIRSYANGRIDTDEALDRMREESRSMNPPRRWTPGAMRTRLSKGKAIFLAGLEHEALSRARSRRL